MILEGQCGAFNPLLLQCLREIAGTLVQELQAAARDEQAKGLRNKIDYDRLFTRERSG